MDGWMIVGLTLGAMLIVGIVLLLVMWPAPPPTPASDKKENPEEEEDEETVREAARIATKERRKEKAEESKVKKLEAELAKSRAAMDTLSDSAKARTTALPYARLDSLAFWVNSPSAQISYPVAPEQIWNAPLGIPNF